MLFGRRALSALDGKESAYKAGDSGWIPGSGRSPGGGSGNPLRCSCLENPMRGAWQAVVYGVAKSQTRLSYQRFHFSFSKPPPLLQLNMCVLHDPGRRVRKGREGKAGFLSFTEHLLGTQNKVFYFYYFIYFIFTFIFKLQDSQKSGKVLLSYFSTKKTRPYRDW